MADDISQWLRMARHTSAAREHGVDPSAILDEQVRLRRAHERFERLIAEYVGRAAWLRQAYDRTEDPVLRADLAHRLIHAQELAVTALEAKVAMLAREEER